DGPARRHGAGRRELARRRVRAGPAWCRGGARGGRAFYGPRHRLSRRGGRDDPSRDQDPGAKAAQVGPFMALMVTDTYSDGEQATFRDGMRKLDQACQAMHHASFIEATPPQRLALLEQLDREQKAYMDARHGDDTPAHYFRMMKELALLGYFTSEIGYTKAM